MSSTNKILLDIYNTWENESSLVPSNSAAAASDTTVNAAWNAV